MADPYPAGLEGQSLPAAAEWLEMLLTGRLATIVAVIAVAFLGYSMLAGHFSPRRALRVVLGCFLVFGSSAIARSLIEATRPPAYPATLSSDPVRSPVMPGPGDARRINGNPFDPYSGGQSSP